MADAAHCAGRRNFAWGRSDCKVCQPSSLVRSALNGGSCAWSACSCKPRQRPCEVLRWPYASRCIGLQSARGGAVAGVLLLVLINLVGLVRASMLPPALGSHGNTGPRAPFTAQWGSMRKDIDSNARACAGAEWMSPDSLPHFAKGSPEAPAGSAPDRCRGSCCRVAAKCRVWRRCRDNGCSSGGAAPGSWSRGRRPPLRS